MTPSELMRTISVNLSARRRELGMTQLELSAASGIRQPVISRAERGNVQLSLESLANIATALRTSPALLCTEGAYAEEEIPEAVA